MKPDIYHYDSYRNYVYHWLKHIKSEKEYYSQTLLAMQCKISVSALNNALSGKRNITLGTAGKIAEGLKLKKNEKEFFMILVEYTQENNVEKKQKLYKKIESYRLGQDSSERLQSFFSDWRLSLVRELACMVDFGDDFQKLSSHCRQNIPPAEMEKLVNRLVELGLIKKENGKYIQSEPFIKAYNIPPSSTYHRTADLTELGKAALYNIPKDERYIVSHTLSVSRNTYHEIIEMIDEIGRKIEEESVREENPDEVVQLNMQLFPLSKKAGSA